MSLKKVKAQIYDGMDQIYFVYLKQDGIIKYTS